MSELAAIQSGFAAALLPGSRAAAALPLFRGDPARTARRLGIYRGNIRANAIKALSAAHPVVTKIVGDEFFDGLATEYARRTPSASGDLNEYGAGFGDFLAGFEPAAELPYLPDVARLEWLVHAAHYAADQPPLQVAKLAQLSENLYPALRLHLHPACALLRSEWPITRIWQIHQDGYDGEFSVDMTAGPSAALVFRPHLRTEVRGLGAGELAFLEYLTTHADAKLGAGLTAAMTADQDFMLDAAFQRWLDERVIVEFSLPRP